MGASLAAVGTHLNDAALQAVRKELKKGLFFTVQLVSFVHRGVPKVCYVVWVPHAGGSFRGLFRIEDISDLYSRTCSTLSAQSEHAVVHSAVEEFLIEEHLSHQKLLSVVCNLTPNSWALYENETRSRVLELRCVVPAALTADNLMTWHPQRLERVLEFLEKLAILCSSDSYLSRVLSSFGVVLSNLPSRQSFLYWSFVGQALGVIMREHRQLARLISNGMDSTDQFRQAILGQLDDAGFLAHCHLLSVVAVPLGNAVKSISTASTLTDFLLPILNFLNWLIGELTTRGANVLQGICWEILFEGPGEVRELDDRRQLLPVLRQVALRHVESNAEVVHQEMQECLVQLYQDWCIKWEALLGSSLARIALVPYYRATTIQDLLEEMKNWAGFRLSGGDNLAENLDEVQGRLGPYEPVGAALSLGYLDVGTPLGLLCLMALLVNR